MKTLDFKQMEKLSGGEIDCGEGLGFTVGSAIMLGLIAGATGGVGLAIISIGWMWGGGAAAISNCQDDNWAGL
ncbi:hypothetical protein [Gaetbulibacter jejuensis]|uniref:hypothetical protein n=1 Tax=Gaetbulibacter jejuensis TaxID=584607 RepID=UPI003009B1DA